MADGAPRTPFAADQAADRLYIIDARNAVERRILLDWIHATSDGSGGGEDPQWASLDIEDGDHALPVDVLRARLGVAPSRLVVPLRVAWRIPGFDRDRALKLRHLIFGDPRHPGSLRARLILLRDRRRAQILVGEAATLDALRDRFARRPAAVTARAATAPNSQASSHARQLSRSMLPNAASGVRGTRCRAS